MITAVVPTFNSKPEALRRTLLSILETLGGDGELLVVNDGGAPVDLEALLSASEGAADSYVAPGAADAAGTKIRLIDLPENRGPAAALNAGYEEASGVLVARCDVGDVWFPDAKAVQLADAASLARRGSVAFFGRAIDEVAKQIRPLDPKWARRIYRDNQFQASTTVVPRAVWKAEPFDDSLRYADDWDWMMRVQHRFGWQLFDEVVGTATAWPKSRSDASIARELADRAKVAERADRLRHKARPEGAA